MLAPLEIKRLMNHALTASQMGTCPRKRVGAAIAFIVQVLNKEYISLILCEGANTSLPNEEGCDSIGCDLVQSVDPFTNELKHNCVRTVHAEVQAISKLTSMYNNAHVYDLALATNTYPCWNCFKLIVSIGIKQVYFMDLYNPDPRVKEYADKNAILLFDASGIMKGFANTEGQTNEPQPATDRSPTLT